MADREPHQEEALPKWGIVAEAFVQGAAWLFLLGLSWLGWFLFEQEWHLAQYFTAGVIVLLGITVVALYRRSRRRLR